VFVLSLLGVVIGTGAVAAIYVLQVLR